MNFVLIFSHILIIGFVSFYYWKRQEPSLKKYFLPGLIFKLACGIALGLVYTFYYHVGDTFQYFEDGKILSSIGRRDFASYVSILAGEHASLPQEMVFSDARALFFVKIVSVLNVLTGDNYWIGAMYLSLLSFSGAWTAVQIISGFFSGKAFHAAIAFLFFPSAVFWTSGMIKESMACGALYFLIGIFLKAWFKGRLSIPHALLAVPALLVLWILKYYYAAIFIAVAATSLLHHFFISPLERSKSVFLGYLLWVIVLILPLAFLTFLHPNFYMDRFLEVIVSNNRVYNAVSSPQDIIHYNSLEPSVLSFLINSPWALFSGIFRPFLTEADNVFEIAASAENFLLLVLAVTSLKNLPKALTSDSRFVFFSAMVFIVLLGVFLSLSTPNFGTLSRYRAAFIPVLAFLLLCNNPVLNWIQSRFVRL